MGGVLTEGPPPRRRARVLILEDDRDFRAVLEAGLGRRYDARFVARGDAVVEAAQEHRPDLVILDIHVPGLNGFLVCESLKGRRDFRHIPVLFMTSRRDQWSLARARGAGGDDCITKPFDIKDLVSRIDGMIGA